MKLFNFLKRNKDDQEDDDGFDEDGPRTVVIDDETELNEEGGKDDLILDSEIEEAMSSEDSSVPVSDEPMIGEESKGPDFGEDEFDFDDDDDDDEDEDEDVADDDTGRSPMLFVFVGAAVLLIGVIGGAGFWFLSGDEEQVATGPAVLESTDTAVAVAIAPRLPQKGGGLNAIGTQGITPPSQNANAASPAEKKESPSSDVAPIKSDARQPLTAAQKKAAALASITGVGTGSSLNAAAGTVPRDSGQGLVVPSVTSVSYQTVPDQGGVVPLASAPDETLVQEVAGLANPLPIIGKDGRQPWQVYARPFIKKTDNPKVAIIVKGLGFSRAASMAAIKKLPGEVTLAFSPYVSDLNDWMLRARLSGHEVLLELPLESKNFPLEDAGPLALSTGLQVADNIKQLNNVMSRMTGYVGLLSVMGSKFNEAEGQLKPILTEIKQRGLLFVDGGGGKSRARRIAAEIGLPRAFSNVYLDDPPSRRAMDQKLQGLDQLVRKQAAAIAIIHAYPNTIERILIWIRTMEQRNLTLVPVTELADKQFIQ